MALQAQTSAKSHHHDHSQNRPPKAFLIGCGLLIAFALIGTTVAKFTGVGQFAPRSFEAVATRDLTFADRADGGIIATDALTGEVATEWAPGQGNFVRTALRALSYSRQKAGGSAGEPFRLTLTREGVLLLSDPLTAREVVLNAFSSANAAEFAILLPEAELTLAEGGS